MKVAVTGPRGLVGWHLMCALRATGHIAIGVDRHEFDDEQHLAEIVGGVDAVVHAAGANRGPDDDVFAANVGLAERLAAALSTSSNSPHVVYTNSTHIHRDTRYGESKRRSAEILGAAAAGRLANLVLPGIFGEHGRPFYNSVVSTFAYQLATGTALSVNDDAQIELLHAQDAADVILDAACQRTSGEVSVQGERTTVMGLASRMTDLTARYDAGVIPGLATHFDRALFNTIRSYRFPERYPTPLEPRVDQRGSLVEVVKADTGGQSFLSWTNPGITRGNHFHRRKVERFVVVAGQARIRLRRLGCADVVHFDVSGDSPVAIDIPTLHTHNITNTGGETLTTMFWADEIFDLEHPDTVFEEV
jgi:UDP-2-acetamido-2,6-beta-L-arabino-hexul-4-ose reductase